MKWVGTVRVGEQVVGGTDGRIKMVHITNITSNKDQDGKSLCEGERECYEKKLIIKLNKRVAIQLIELFRKYKKVQIRNWSPPWLNVPANMTTAR